MSPPDPLPASALLAESAWLHRLALRLVAEPAGAADAAQETLVRALERPPRTAVPLRRWLATVLRNVVRQERRTSGRRDERERARPAEGAVESSDVLAARLELHARLLEEVRALDEPYRSTIALRFLEDRSVHEVAARLGVPEKTVYTRIERALGILRARLDRAHGRREAWVGLLLPAGVAPAAPAAAPPGAAVPAPAVLTPILAMSPLWKWTGACAVLATLGLFAVRSLSEPDGRGTRAPAVAATPPPSNLEVPPKGALEEETPGSPEREARAPAPQAEPAPPFVAAAEPTRLEGFVRDLERRPVPDLEVRLEPLAPTPSHPESAAALAPPVRSDGEGRFGFPADPSHDEPGPCRIVASGRGYATVLSATLAGPPPPEPPVVWVAPARDYSGQVVDPNGTPLADVELGVYPDRELLRTLSPGAFAGVFPIAERRSDAEGRFTFEAIGGAPGSHLAAGAPGYRPAKLDLPDASASALEIVLEPEAGAPRALAGRVLRLDGSPAEGAWVSTGQESVHTDAQGHFEIALDEKDHPERLQAALAGVLPAELVLHGLPESRWREIELVLGDAPLTIVGRVLDAQGEALEGARVWTEDGERFGNVPRQLGAVSFSLTYDLEDIVHGDAEAEPGTLHAGREARSGANGHFELRGLLARSYGLWAMDPHTRELAGPFAVSAGAEGVVLRLEGTPTRRVAGRVLTLSGAPLAGVQVNVERRLRGAGGRLRPFRGDLSGRIETDEEGRFAFEALCTEGTWLVVSAADAPRERSYELALEPDPERLELRFPATCHLRVHLDDPERAESLELLDENGESLELTFQIGGVLCSSAAVQIEGGVSDLLTADESVRTLVLWKGNEVSERIPVQVSPGEVNEIRP